MEFCGVKPLLVPCHKDNIKITYPEDLQLAEWILRDRQQSSTLSNGA
jgi:2-C-methyl-D-erythritol 4-phosphate cytidylyltransferase